MNDAFWAGFEKEAVSVGWIARMAGNGVSKRLKAHPHLQEEAQRMGARQAARGEQWAARNPEEAQKAHALMQNKGLATRTGELPKGIKTIMHANASESNSILPKVPKRKLDS